MTCTAFIIYIIRLFLSTFFPPASLYSRSRLVDCWTGILFPWFVAFLTTYNESMSVSGRWRFVLGFGSVPLFLAICGLVAEKHLYGDGTANSEAVAAREGSSSTSISTSTNIRMARIRTKICICVGLHHLLVLSLLF